MSARFGSRLRSAVDLVAAVAMIVTAVVVLWGAVRRPSSPSLPATSGNRATPATSIPSEAISLDSAIVKGSPTATTVIVEYADLQCPACAKFANDTFPALATQYVDTGRVLFGFRHFPLPNHPRAKPAAIAAQCAGEQGRFWEMYGTLFRDPSKLDDGGLEETVRSLGLDARRWSACLKTDVATRVQQDFEEAMRLKISGTPTFLIGTIGLDRRMHAIARFDGARPLVDFDAVIAQVEKTAGTGK